jgi:hypothetical protein
MIQKADVLYLELHITLVNSQCFVSNDPGHSCGVPLPLDDTNFENGNFWT